MDIRKLRYFVQIVEAGNLRKAASKLHVAQPSLSRHIRELEEEFGVKLLERHARGVTVTRAGTRLFERAKHILREIEQTRTDLIAESGVLTGHAALGSSETMSRVLFGAIAERFKSEYPGVSLDLVEGRAYRLLEGLDTGRLDLALMVGVDPRPNLDLLPVMKDRLYLVCHPDDAPIPGDSISLMTMQSMPLVVYKRPSSIRMVLENHALRAGVSLNIAYEVESLDVLRNFVSRRLAFGVLPQLATFCGAESFKLKALPIEGLSVTRYMVRRCDQANSPVVAELARFIREELDVFFTNGLFSEKVIEEATR